MTTINPKPGLASVLELEYRGSPDAHCLACGFEMLGGASVGLCAKCGSNRWYKTRLDEKQGWKLPAQNAREDSDLLCRLHTLRSYAGDVKAQADAMHLGSIAATCAAIVESATAAIDLHNQKHNPAPANVETSSRPG